MRLLLARATPVNRIFAFTLLHAVVMSCAWLVDVMPAAAHGGFPSAYVYCQPDTDADAVGYGAGNCTLTSCSAGYTQVWTGNSNTCSGVVPENDNCPAHVNTNQLDTDSDGIGDACDGTPQTITLTTVPPGSAVFNSTFPVAATASSGLPVVITTSGGCTITGGSVTITSAVSACLIYFNQAGDASYASAPQLINSVAVATNDQTITVTVPAPAIAANGSYFSVAATASSGLPVAITVSGGCTLANNIITVTSDVTACSVYYNQLGNQNTGAALQVSSSTTVNAGAAQTITVTTPAPPASGSSFTVAATASSGLPVVVTTSGNCTVVGSVVTMSSALTLCTVNYTQAGNATYTAAPVISSVTLPSLVNPVQVSAGYQHMCVLDSTGVRCNGYNGDGQASVYVLLNPTQVSVAGHTCALDSAGVHCSGAGGNEEVPVLLNPVQVSAGGSHTCALDSRGVHCWGTGTHEAVPALVNPVQVSAGYEHSCAIDNSGVHCWGLNDLGQTTVPALTNPVYVSGGGSHTCAIDNTGVHCWGANNVGQLTVPVLINPVQVAAGNNHTCALDDSGVHCWGAGTTNTGIYPEFGQSMVPALVNPVYVSAGSSHTCAVDDTGVVCWGNNIYNQVMNIGAQFGTTSQSITVTTAPPASALFNTGFTVAATASSGLPVVITVTGSCTLVGDTVTMNMSNKTCTVNFRQPGNATYAAATTVSSVIAPIGLFNPKQISAGSQHTCVLDDAGVQCWGAGTTNTGDLIDGALGQSIVPALVNPIQVTAGAYHTCALDDTGVQCWGWNYHGQTTVPALVNPVQVSAGNVHTCALDDTGVHCWGYNDIGQTTVPALVNPVQVSAGAMHTCALDDTGLHCWGDNTYGETDVPALINPVQVSAGLFHTCALDDTGAHCWGSGTMNTGNPDVGQSIVPALTNPVQVSAGLLHTCALDDTGVHCWGAGTMNTGYEPDYGQSIVPALTNPVQVSAGAMHTCAIDNTGVVCWGYNADGEAESLPGQFTQTITLVTAPPASAELNDTFPVAATASSGLPVVINATGGCTEDVGTVTVTSDTITCIVNFDQPGDANHEPATPVTTFTIPFVDADNDGVADTADNCRYIANSDQLNMDADALGDVCDGDIDGDGVPNGIDANPLSAASAIELILPLDGTHQGAKISGGVRSQ